MEYAKIIAYGETAEVFRYDKRPSGRGGAVARSDATTDALPHISQSGENGARQVESQAVRTEANARRAALAFRRIVASNLGADDAPVLASLTYGQNISELQQGHADFNAFARSLRSEHGSGIRYIAVCEFQKRGALHFHTLIWGLLPGTVERERSTRMVAKVWGKGFVDLVQTDGAPALAGYLAKYLSKTFQDPRLLHKKAYIASRNIKRPYIQIDAILATYYYGQQFPDLSTALLLQEKEYTTQWLGRAHYQKYQVTPQDHGKYNPDQSDSTGVQTEHF